MDRTIWKIVLQSIGRASRRLPRPTRRPQFPDSLIVAMFLWSVWQHRPLSWACHRCHYGSLFRPRKLPSISQFTRRIKTRRCQQILQHMHDQLAAAHHPTSLSYLDGKSMLVSPVSNDRQAKWGKVSGAFAKGYKLHAWVMEDGRIPLWGVSSLNTGEAVVARALCQRMPRLADDALVLGDTAYDSRHLHNLIAARNGRLLTSLKGAARHQSSLWTMGPVRRETLAMWRARPGLVKLLLRNRIAVENVFSQICELSRPPGWVRGITRVTRWAGGILLLYHARLRARWAMKRHVA